jgi:hypothetical protein
MLVALLNKDFIIKGYEETEGEEEVSRFRVPLPSCDLPVGKYKWDHDKQAFLPVSGGPEEQIARPNVLKAIARGLMAVRDGKPLPKATLDWLADYEQSMDNKD